MDKFNLNKCTESLAPGLRGKYAGTGVPKLTIDELYAEVGLPLTDPTYLDRAVAGCGLAFRTD